MNTEPTEPKVQRLILIAEDNHEKAHVVAKLARRLGFFTRWCASANEAIRYLKTEYAEEPAQYKLVCVVSDWNMPLIRDAPIRDGSGELVVKTALALHYPVVVFSGDERQGGAVKDVPWLVSARDESLLRSFITEQASRPL